MRIIAFITEAPAVREVLAHLSEVGFTAAHHAGSWPTLWQMADAGQRGLNP